MMEQSYQANPHIKRFILYSFSYALIGSLIVAMGPLIPYYSEKENKSASQYSIILLARSIGYIVGSVSVKITEKSFTIHQNLTIGFLISGIFAILFNYSENIIIRCIFFFMLACGMSITDIFCNVGIVECFKDTNYQKWLQIMHGCLSLGGLIVPFIVYLIQLQTYMLLGIICLLLLPAILVFKSPQLLNKKEKSYQIEQNRIEQIIQNQNSHSNTKFITTKIVILLCISFFLVDGLESAFGSWISEYAVVRTINSKQAATMYSFTFWISITIFRFVFAFVGFKVSLKIGILTFFGFISSIGVLFIVYQVDGNFGLIFSSAFIGLCDASIFASLVSLPAEYKLQIKPEQLSTLILFSVIGQGVLSTLAGFLIDTISPEMLFLSTSLYFFLIFVNNINLHFSLSRSQNILEFNTIEPAKYKY